MQSPFVSDSLCLAVFVVSCLAWFAVELGVNIRYRTRFHAGAQRQDKGPYIVLGILIPLGAAVWGVLVYMVPATAIMNARVFLFWLGILLICAGIALRMYAIHLLGDSFITKVAIAPEQPVIEVRPYRLIRHHASTKTTTSVTNRANRQPKT